MPDEQEPKPENREYRVPSLGIYSGGSGMGIRSMPTFFDDSGRIITPVIGEGQDKIFRIGLNHRQQDSETQEE